jgi:hypothetical protein
VETVQIREDSVPTPVYNGDGGLFAHGNPGRPKGIPDKRALTGRQAAQALAAKAWGVVQDLLASEDERIRLDATKLVLAYAHGQPHQSVEVDLRGAVEREAVRIGAPADEIFAECARLALEAERAN